MIFLSPYIDSGRIGNLQCAHIFSIDNELTRYYELEFDGNHAIWGIREDNSNVLVWEADGLSFTIYGNPNISELIKVAEGITVDSTLK